VFFNSYLFWIFFGFVAVVYWRLGHRAQNWWLLVASYYFYGCWDWRFLALIFACTVVNYHASLRIVAANNARVRKRWLIWAVAFSLGVLGIFKYFNFFAHELGVLLAWLGLGGESWTFHILLPAGISFFTFQALSYTVDVYRGETRVCRDFWNFALFKSFFPQLVAGPIERSSHLLPQIENPRPRCDSLRFKRGLYCVLTGLFLKVVIADNMAWLANYIFRASPESLNAPDVLVGLYAFAFQIYGDFAGYSAIAVGTACWLGFDLMSNFRRPYFATNPREFWDRWHISLSTWLRDYVYIPMGGNRHGDWNTARNLFITMLLGGLWHGAAWTFIAWGGIHGLWLILHRSMFQRRKIQGRSPTVRETVPAWLTCVKWLIAFHLICLTWLFFRAASFQQVLALLHSLGNAWSMTSYAQTCCALLLFFVGPWIAYEAWQERQRKEEALLDQAWFWRAAFYAYLVLMLLFFPPPAPSEFIYFQF